MSGPAPDPRDAGRDSDPGRGGKYPGPTPEPDCNCLPSHAVGFTVHKRPCRYAPAEPDATVSDHAPLTDAEREALGCKDVPGFPHATLCPVPAVARIKAEAVEEERAARLALVAKIEALADKPAMESGVPVRRTWVHVDDLRALLTADDTKALDDAKAQAWDEAAEAVADWMSNNPSPSGIPHDPPRNPYDAHLLPAQDPS